MTIYRGPGGGGNATTDAEITTLTSLTNRSEASAAAAVVSANQAAASGGNASSSASSASSSASSASDSASTASTQATNASNSASAASASASSAAGSADEAAATLASKANLASPTFTGTVGGITASMVGLGNTDNTSDVNKPVSTAQQTSLNLKAPLASPSFTGTVSGVSASMVGLGDVTNTSDANKPVSTAQQTALNLKSDLATAQSFTAAQRGAVVSLTDGATITPDFSLSNNFSVTLAGSRTLANPTNIVAGQSGVITITQDATGSRALAFGSYWKFSSGAAIALTTAASSVDDLAYYVESSTRIVVKALGDAR